MPNFLANNLARASASSGPVTRTAIGIGKGLWRGVGALAGGADEAAGALLDAGLKPGGMASRAVGEAASSLTPLIANKYTALGAAAAIPAYHFYDQAATGTIEPLFTRSVEEGRSVLASDINVMEKKAAELEKKADVLEMLQAVLHGAGKGGLQDGLGMLGQARAARGAMGPMTKATASLGTHAGGMLAGAGASMLGSGIGALMNAAPLGQAKDTFGYRLNKQMNPLMDRIKADEIIAQKVVSGLGDLASKTINGLLTDMGSKAMQVMQPRPDLQSMVQGIQQGDDILERGDVPTLMNAYHSMSKFAPTLAQDENAVRSFLREALMSGNGPDYASIANLARAEADIRKAQSPMGKMGSDDSGALEALRALVQASK